MSKDIKIKLGQKIKELRNKKGLTQQELAELAGIDYKYYQRIEGKNPPNLKVETVDKIAKALNQDISKLFKM